MHTHEFDQFYFVIEGALEVQIGLDMQVVGPNTLVVLPAGVPHKQRNASETDIERHFTILVPEPALCELARAPVGHRRRADGNRSCT